MSRVVCACGAVQQLDDGHDAAHVVTFAVSDDDMEWLRSLGWRLVGQRWVCPSIVHGRRRLRR